MSTAKGGNVDNNNGKRGKDQFIRRRKKMTYEIPVCPDDELFHQRTRLTGKNMKSLTFIADYLDMSMPDAVNHMIETYAETEILAMRERYARTQWLRENGKTIESDPT